MRVFQYGINKNCMGRVGYIVEYVRSVGEGDTMTFALDSVNPPVFRAVCSRLNKMDGYRHYSVAVNSTMGIMGIVNNGNKYKQ